ncbi:MAG: cupin domain-containing protein [Acidobacteria bacterium]|nr:cupin domain-containing protein [Acidobacteriota bacterium]
MPKLTISLLIAACAVGVWPVVAQQPTVERKVLLQQDLTIPGYQNVLVAVTIPAGGRESRHTHPGTLLVHVLEGALTLDHDGRPTRTYTAGESVYIEPGRVHEGINKGMTPVRAIASFVVEKGKPLTAQVQ